MAEKNGHSLAVSEPRTHVFTPAPHRTTVPPPPTQAELKPLDFIHALRRRWLLCFPLACLLGAAAAVGAYVAQKPIYEATAVFQLSSTNTQLMFDEFNSTGKFEYFQGTQRELAKSRTVMEHALRDPIVADAMPDHPRPLDWLHSKIKVSTPKDTELMTISLKHDHKENASVLVNGVVRAYQTLVVNQELNSRQEQYDSVDDLYKQTQETLRNERERLHSLAREFGTSDRATLTKREETLVGQLGELRESAMRTKLELVRARLELQNAQARLARLAEDPTSVDSISAAELAAALLRDRPYQALQNDAIEARRLGTEARSGFKEGVPDLHSSIEAAAEAQAAERREIVKEQLNFLAPMQAQEAVQKWESEVSLLTGLLSESEREVAKLEGELGMTGNQSMDVELLRADINNLEKMLQTITQERAQMKVELRSRPRVELFTDAQEAVLSNRIARYSLAGLAGVLAFLAPIGLILMQDVRAGKVNDSRDVIRFADLDVVGTVPLIPTQAIRHLSSGRRGRSRYEYWQMVLSESVSRIASSLLSDTRRDSPRMLMITSAVGGEGKTTLSTQLAMSLARAGRSVVLVDIDLRRPMIHSTFGLNPGPGICEALRGEADVSEIVQPTSIPNLSAVTAGDCDRMAIQLLGHESTASLLKELRALGEFVIVDGCPVLPLADTGYICPHVDAVLFSVRRDVSRMSQVKSAHDFIRKCGNRVLGAVVTEGNGYHYRDDRYYLTGNDQ